METSLHRALKDRYAAGLADRREVRVAGFRIDAVDDDGRFVEIQSGALGPLRRKLDWLLPQHRLRIVKPVILSRRLIQTSRRGGSAMSVRRSPKRGMLVDIFDDLIGLVRVFPHANLEIEVLGVTIDEVRIRRRRRPGYSVTDRRLGEIRETATLSTAGDLWGLLPPACHDDAPFTTVELASRLAKPVWFAQRVAYCLRKTGAARVMGKSGNRLIYARDGSRQETAGPGVTDFSHEMRTQRGRVRRAK
jgi:hypothetical protein